MGPSRTVRLAQDIAEQFAHLPNDEAAAAVAGHIRTFWDPRMRQQFVSAVTLGQAGPDPILTAVVARLGPVGDPERTTQH